MSLDICLKMKGAVTDKGSGIFVREYGETRQISREEWDSKFPGSEPIVAESPPDIIGDEAVFEANITHNLTGMAEEAGLYYCVWRPEEIGITKAGQLIGMLANGIKVLKSDPERFKKLNPPNGWGSYDRFVPWLERYLEACKRYPDAEVNAWR